MSTLTMLSNSVRDRDTLLVLGVIFYSISSICMFFGGEGRFCGAAEASAAAEMPQGDPAAVQASLEAMLPALSYQFHCIMVLRSLPLMLLYYIRTNNDF